MTLDRRGFLSALVAGGAGAAVVATGGQARAREPRHPSPGALGLLYDATRCIGCKACVVACADANGLARERTGASGEGMYQDPVRLTADTKNVIKLHEGPRGSTFVKVQCMHCVDPACVSVCMMGALHKAAGDVVAYDIDRCVGCRYCQVACPFNVPAFEWDTPTPQIVKCELCRHRYAGGKGPACAEVCPERAVIFGLRDHLLAEAKARLAADPKRYNPKVYGETDAGGTGVLYLAPAGVTFAELGLPDLGDEPVPDLVETIQHSIYQGFIIPGALYIALGGVIYANLRRAGKVDAAPDEEDGS